jgi:hypothetical protein
MKTSHILFVIISILTLSSCQSNLLHKNQFQKMHDHKASIALREIFDFYSSINCPDAATKGARSFDNKQFAMLKEKFLVLDIKEIEDSEFVVHIAIAPKNHPEKVRMWRFVLVESEWEKSGYEIIKFDEYPFRSKEGKKWLFDEEHLKYWVESGIV